MKIKLFALYFTFTLYSMSVHAQSTTIIDQLGFMEGHWTRITDGMHVEQVFLPPIGGTIVGIQRRTRNDTTLVSYFFIIQQTENGVICRFKHFENDYKTYEDRNQTGPRTFKLIEHSPSSVIFEERTLDDSLYLQYRITEAKQLAIAVGSLENLRSHKIIGSLHDKVH